MRKSKLLVLITVILALLFAISFTVSAQETDKWVQNPDGTYSYLDGNGDPYKDGEYWINEKAYRFDENGIMIVGWYEDGDYWYYYKSSGAKISDEVCLIGNKYYAFDSSSIMFNDTVFYSIIKA